VKRVLVAAALVALALPGTAWAHATLLTTRPAVGQRLAQSPRVVMLKASVAAAPGKSIVVYWPPLSRNPWSDLSAFM